jgi:3-phenylpropionate/trans-cinnamate dioxygenase ferredoxin reductase subunit
VTPTFVIIGASLAGASAAVTLRQEGFNGEIVLVGAEPSPPYERPALSKQYLRGEMPFDKLLVRPLTFYQEHRIELLLGGRAARLDSGQRIVELETGRRLRYDKLLLATGARNRRLPIAGADLRRVLSLRSVADADALRAEIRPGCRAVVIGMGFIGSEVAASLRQKGVEVVAVEPAPAPLFRVLGHEVGKIIAGVHRDNGVETIFDDSAARFEGHGAVARVVTARGRRLECDLVVLGVGVDPDTDYLEGSGVATDNGVLVDEYCRTNVHDIFAAGDIANHYHPLFRRRMRVEHWQNAMQQAAAAARNMLGQQRPYDALHWFWSDQYDINLQYAGAHDPSARFVVRGASDGRRLLGFYLSDDRVVAVVAINRGKDLRRVMRLISSRATVDAERLADEAVDIRDLLPAASTERS